MDNIAELFSNNLINWILLVLILVYLWLRITPALFQSRKDKIDSSLQEANLAREEGLKFLAEQKKRVESAEVEAQEILTEAKRVAEEMRKEIEEQTVLETSSFKERIKQQIEAEKQLAITEMRSRAATVAVRLAEATLPGATTETAKSRLLSQFVEQLESAYSKK